MRGSCTTTRPESLAKNALRWTCAGRCCANSGVARCRANAPPMRKAPPCAGPGKGGAPCAYSRKPATVASRRLRAQGAALTRARARRVGALAKEPNANSPAGQTGTRCALAKESCPDAYKRTTLVKNKQKSVVFGACMVSATPTLTPGIWLGREGARNPTPPSQH